MKNMNDPRSDEYKYPEGDMNEAHEPINEANAHLLAAAPELLEACRSLVALEMKGKRCGYCNADYHSGAPHCPVRMAAEALAKATKGGGEK